MDSKNAGKSIKETCQFLGTANDPLVSYYFPNRQNFCNRIMKPESIDLHHQEVYCLSSKHMECIVYREETITQLPDDILNVIPETENRNNIRNILVFLSALIVFVTIMTTFLVNSLGVENIQTTAPATFQSLDHLQKSNAPVITTTPNQIDLLFLLPAKTESSDKTLTLDTQPQSSPTIGPGFSTPFGTTQTYLLHEVKSGESMLYIADLYGTKVDALIKINSLEGAPPIQIGQLIIVKPGATVNSNLDRLDAILLTKDTAIETIAEDYRTTIEVIIDLNELDYSAVIPSGRWLIVPKNNLSH